MKTRAASISRLSARSSRPVRACGPPSACRGAAPSRRRSAAGAAGPARNRPVNGGIAHRIRARWRYGFYDSLVIAAALAACCARLLSEDLQDGQRIESLTIVDPFPG